MGKKQYMHVCVIFLVLLWASSAVQGETITIMAANTSSGNYQSYEDPGIRIFQGIQPDIVLIQEFTYRSGTLRDLVDTAFGTEYEYYVEDGDENIPNGVVSRYPILSAGQWIDDEVPDRDFAWAVIDIPGEINLQVVSVHLKSDSSTTQTIQAEAIEDYIQANFDPTHYIVVGGDMNVTSRTASAIQVFDGFLDPDHYIPVDQDGESNTNEPRNKPYDWIIPNSLLNSRHTTLQIGSSTFPQGLVVDSAVYEPLSEISPVQYGDSHVFGMQHMAVVCAYEINTGTPPATFTPTATPTPTPTSTQTPVTSPTITPTPGQPISGAPWINEIHYDNASGDENEGVEIAGPSGLDLSEYTLVPYNGSNGTQYSITSLSGTLPGQQDCLGTLWFAIAGLQNGAPDGIALVDSSDTVIQFLSYEGVFSAVDGPAQGMSSQDIGVSESGTTSSSESLQLAGTGSMYSDFTWQAPAANSRGNVNIDQVFSGGCATPLPTNSPLPTASPEPTATPTVAPPTYTPTANPTQTPEPSGTPECVHHGDVTMDGSISAGDAQLAFSIVLNLYTPTYPEECAADCNNDGSVSAGDAQLIFYSVLSIDSCAEELPVFH